MDTLDKKVIYYDGIQDMSWCKKENLVAYTSMKNCSSSLMSKQEFFNNYLYTRYQRTYIDNSVHPIYIHKQYKNMEE